MEEVNNEIFPNKNCRNAWMPCWGLDLLLFWFSCHGILCPITT